MAISFFDKSIYVPSSPAFAAVSKAIGDGDDVSIPTIEDLTGIELRLLPPFIVDNGTPAVWPFPGRAKLYCLTVVVSDVSNQLIGGIDLQGFHRIGDREHLPINKTIFYWEPNDDSKKAPSQIHTFCCVMKSKGDLRNTGEILSQVKSDEDYKSVISSVTELVSNGTPAGALVNAITSIVSVVGKFLKEVEDKPLGTTVNSYTALAGNFSQAGVFKNIVATRNVNFEFELTVRDKTRSEPVEKSLDDIAVKAVAPVVEQEDVLVELLPL